MTYWTLKILQSPPVEVEETVILHIFYFAMKLEFSAFICLFRYMLNRKTEETQSSNEALTIKSYYILFLT